jgi:hypothetical protein
MSVDQTAAAASTLIAVVIVGLIAEVNLGQILGSVASARAGAKQSWAFFAGTIASRLVQALVGASLATAVADKVLGSIRLGWLAYTLMALAGLVIVLEAVRLWIRRRREGPPAAPASGITKRIGTGSALASGFLINIVYLPNWIYVSAVVTSIAVLKVSWVTMALLFIAFLAASTWIGLWLSSLRLLRPGRAASAIDGVGDWTDAHAPVILVWLLVVVGAILIYVGTMGVLGKPLG